MTRNHQIGNWSIYQDAPEYGCTDNPSYEWFANEYINGHWTGRTLRNADRAALETEVRGAQ